MAQTINTNVPSMNAQRNIAASQASMSVSMQRLSSGLRVNSAKDDAAGLAISERMTAQTRGMSVAMRNANDAISLAQTAEGAIGKIGDALQRMRELAVQSANGTNNSGDRDNMQTEFAELQSEITRLVDGTKFNDHNLLNAATTFTFQVGANTGADDTIDVDLSDVKTDVDTPVAALDISGATAAGASAAIDALDDAIDSVTTTRAKFGAIQNRFETVVSTLMVANENLTASRSRITDTDYAVESANLSRSQILQQAGTAMVAQANQAPQQVLSLLR